AAVSPYAERAVEVRPERGVTFSDLLEGIIDAVGDGLPASLGVLVGLLRMASRPLAHVDFLLDEFHLLLDPCNFLGSAAPLGLRQLDLQDGAPALVDRVGLVVGGLPSPSQRGTGNSVVAKVVFSRDALR